MEEGGREGDLHLLPFPPKSLTLCWWIFLYTCHGRNCLVCGCRRRETAGSRGRERGEGSGVCSSSTGLLDVCATYILQIEEYLVLHALLILSVACQQSRPVISVFGMLGVFDSPTVGI